MPDGGILVDTPGTRELGLSLTLEQLGWYFPEFQHWGAGCKFNDCSHIVEPGCAVRHAVEIGEIPPRRYDSYLRLAETLNDHKIRDHIPGAFEEENLRDEPDEEIEDIDEGETESE